jgi:hypothetical protein
MMQPEVHAILIRYLWKIRKIISQEMKNQLMKSKSLLKARTLINIAMSQGHLGISKLSYYWQLHAE